MEREVVYRVAGLSEVGDRTPLLCLKVSNEVPPFFVRGNSSLSIDAQEIFALNSFLGGLCLD